MRCARNFLLVAVLLASVGWVVVLFSDKAVTEKPALSQITGRWVCREFPSGFIKKAGSPPAEALLEFEENGLFKATHFPLRDPMRYSTIRGRWELSDYPTPAPPGHWMLSLDGVWIHLMRRGSSIFLSYTIDPIYYLEVEFFREDL